VAGSTGVNVGGKVARAQWTTDRLARQLDLGRDGTLVERAASVAGDDPERASQAVLGHPPPGAGAAPPSGSSRGTG
jgi:hypothetical protein